jgi:hypothetical protein
MINYIYSRNVLLCVLIILFSIFFDSNLVFEWADIVYNLEKNGRYVYLNRDSAYMPPLYPYLIYLFRILSKLNGLYLLHLCLLIASFLLLILVLNDSLTIYINSIKKINNNRIKKFSPLFAFSFFIYPPIFHGFTINSIFGISTFLYILYIYQLQKIYKNRSFKNLVFIGLVSGLMTLCRSEFLYVGPIITFLMIIRLSKGVVSISKQMITVSLSIILVLTPWIYRNKIVLGAPVISTAKYYNLVRGNNLSKQKIPPVTPEELYPELLEYKISEVDQEEFLKGKFYDYVQNHPVNFLKGIYIKFSNFFFSYYPVDGEKYHGDFKQYLIYPWLAMLIFVFYILIKSIVLRNDIYIQTLLLSFLLYALIHSLVQVLPRYNLQFIIVFIIVFFNYFAEFSTKNK